MTRHARFLPALLCGAGLFMMSAGAALAAEPPVRTTQLHNGLEVVLAPDPKAASVDVAVWYKAGTITESPGRSGTTTMVGRLMFEGSEHVPAGQFIERLQAEGGVVNTVVYPDGVQFVETLPPEALDLALDLEADRMKGLTFGDADVEEVRKSLLGQRAALRQAGSLGLGIERLYGMAFGDHPYAWPVSGLEQDLEHIDTASLRDYHRKYFSPDRAIVTIVGHFDPDAAMASVKEHFEPLARRPGAQPSPKLSEPTAGRRASTEGSRGHLLLVGWRGPGATSNDMAAMQLLAEIVTGGPSARLERTAVAPGVTARGELDVRREASLLYCIVGVHPKADTAGVEHAIIDRIEAVTTEQISDQERERALKRLESAVVLATQTPHGRAQLLGSDKILTNDDQATAHRLEAMRSISPKTLQEVARKYLTPSRRTVVWVAPADEGGQE